MNKLQPIIIKYAGALLLASLLFAACKKDDHFIGGTPTDPYAKSNLTTYDYLKQNKLFDTLVLMIDRAGMKDEINGNVTFFASTNYSIKTLIDVRTKLIQLKYNNENIKYTLDSFPVMELRDSIRAYMYKGNVERRNLSLERQVFKNMVGEDFIIRLVETTDYSGIFSKPVQYLELTKIIDGQDPDPLPENYPDARKDIADIIQTSGILTKTGVLHVLRNSHKFYWIR
ncbi:hypothetical protein [Chitinophaga solisilvae]|uniref:hypothetical protein n=1 Tax=Chitinophaga solisilvae TaxID=1233460 RepID=UPI00136D1031|nr:hypothetical protein [Chitinophaga solisilvae]